MKKLTYLVFSLLAISITVFACTKDETITEDTLSSSKEIIKPSGVISPERAMELDANWTNTRANIINYARTDGEDNRSSWWSLQDMRNYLDYAENQATELGYTMDGVRVYFGAYSDQDTNGYAGQATMFIVPTGTSNDGATRQAAGSDIQGADPLNRGTNGTPPGQPYPN